jgi:hypothetical protein
VAAREHRNIGCTFEGDASVEDRIRSPEKPGADDGDGYENREHGTYKHHFVPPASLLFLILETSLDSAAVEHSFCATPAVNNAEGLKLEEMPAECKPRQE